MQVIVLHTLFLHGFLLPQVHKGVHRLSLALQGQEERFQHTPVHPQETTCVQTIVFCMCNVAACTDIIHNLRGLLTAAARLRSVPPRSVPL